MGKVRSLPVSAEIRAGDYGRDYVFLTVGNVEVTVYQSNIRPGGVTIEIDGDVEDILKLSVNINDGEIFPGIEE